jgi:hypothetical protein
MAIVINGSGTVTGLAVGGLPDGTVDAGTLATDAVTAAKIATNSVDSAELVDGAVDDSHMASIKGRRNILINGDFSVSQRGDYTSATTATHLQYYLDRFYIAKSGVTGTIQDTGFAAKLVVTSGGTGTLRLVQPIEDMAWLSGKTVTLSCQMKSNDANSRLGIYADAWQSTTAAHTGGGAWETLSMTLTLPSGITTELSAHFGIDGASSANVSISSGAYCEVKDLQLEVGSTATDFEHRGYGEELALCQRYYEFATYGGVVLIGYSSSVGRGSVYLSTPKRIENYTATVATDGYGYWGNSAHSGISFTTSQHEVQCIRVNSNQAPANSSMYVNGVEIRVDAEL